MPSASGEPHGGSKTSRAQWVYESLRNGIQLGRYGRGERIREEEIARALGVSRTPVREAISRLQARGLLEMAPGGLVVATLSRPQTIELYAMREILEGSAARFAAQHASPSEIATLHRLAQAFERAAGDADRQAHYNREFHGAIYEAAHNRYLMRTLDEVHDAMALLPSTTFTVSGRPERAVAEHAAIVAAIEARDADRAEHAARSHIQMAQEARLGMMFDIG
ncbi:GntR family transcriptional regulator [Rhizobiales bacterium L72]|uniref:GntR family transcriptional regulator n=2 Tax=Propylenella binzhouense TaxID=2555902 RepID=A0A964T270_9HYPH|nr:GntR family transcriptional regulator [Propylenella binzhouense]